VPQQETVRPGEALRVTMGADGTLHVGSAGHLRVTTTDPAFFTAVIADLGRVAATPEGRQRVDGERAAGRTIRIEKPFAPTEPRNAWVVPLDPAAAIAAGCSSTIVYDPADWPTERGTGLPSSTEILNAMLRQAEMYASGTGEPLNDAEPATGDQQSGGQQSGADLRLSCRPGKSGNRLTFPYVLQNQGASDVYVMDAIASSDPASHEPRADDQSAVVVLCSDSDVMLGKFLPPTPIDRRMAMPLLPLARRLPPGGTLERQLELPLPLAETSPYFPDLPLRRYEPVDIKGVLVAVGYWAADVDGLVAMPAEYAADLFIVTTRRTARSARRVSQRFPVTALQILKRTDAFPRTLG
jgi:hypothetical protein